MQYIPQAAPFVMIGEIIQADEQQTTTTFRIPEDNLFVSEGYFTEPGLIENMAQTAAAGTGYRAAQAEAPPPVGFIGQIKQLEILQLPKAGELITTTTTNVHQVMNAFIVNGEIRCGETLMARAEYKIFLQEGNQQV